MASFPVPINITNEIASTDLSSSQYKAVVLGSTGIAVAGADVNSIGFLMSQPTAGQVCEVATFGGGAKAIAGGPITQGDYLKIDANGDVIVATLSTENIVAQALDDAVDNDVFAVLPLFNKGA